MSIKWSQDNGMFAFGKDELGRGHEVFNHGTQDWRYDGHSYSSKERAKVAAESAASIDQTAPCGADFDTEQDARDHEALCDQCAGATEAHDLDKS